MDKGHFERNNSCIRARCLILGLFFWGGGGEWREFEINNQRLELVQLYFSK